MWAIHSNQDVMPTSGLISREILASAEMLTTWTCQLTILISNGLPGFLDKCSRYRILWTSLSVPMWISVVMMSEKQKPKHFLDKKLFVYRGTWFETEQETTVRSRGLVVIRQQDWNCHFDRQSAATNCKPKWRGKDASSSQGPKTNASKDQGIFSRRILSILTSFTLRTANFQGTFVQK